MRLFFRHFGTGEPVIILHGLLGLSDNWVTFGRNLAAHYSVFIPDLRNHGQSPHCTTFGFPSMEHDLLEFIEEHNLHNINLIGHSLGGKVAMLFSLHYPEIIKKLIVIDISLRRSFPSNEQQLLLIAMKSINFSCAGSRADIEKQLAVYIESAKLKQFLLKNVYWRTRKQLDWKVNLNAISKNLHLLFDVDIPSGTFPKPVLFIKGGLSGYILQDDIPMIKSKFPVAVVKTIANASHWVLSDAPGELTQVVADFLNSGQ